MSPEKTLLISDDLARETTRSLVGKLESVAFLVQAGYLITTASVDKVTLTGQVLLYGIAGLHLLLAAFTRWKGGPFAHAGPWLVWWLGGVVVMPLVMAHLVAGDYATSPPCVQLCGYPGPPLVILAFYPWAIYRTLYARLTVEIGFLSIAVFEPVLLMLALQPEPASNNYLSVTLFGLGCVLAVVVGKALSLMCRNAARAQVGLQEASFSRFFLLLHSDFKNQTTLMRSDLAHGENSRIAERIDKLDYVITEGRLQMLLVPEHVPLAELLSERIRNFEGRLDIKSIPKVGAITVPRAVAVLVDQALSDLLTNALKYGATTVDISFEIAEAIATMVVSDNGPGLDPSVLDVDGKSLARLRRDARDLGGDVTIQPSPSGGAQVSLSVPLHTKRR